MDKKHEHTNKLIEETSPYLLQHAHNPVDWYPWGQDAFDKAKKENKPIFLSIGYAACHWCHVMERESFENEEIAEILNDHFVCIKVDREERPDLDDIYMTAVVALSGSGGWPMSVFLTPELKPFYGGTYFPPEDRWGRVGFKNLILRLKDFWQNDQSRTRLHRDAETLKKIIEQKAAFSLPQDEAARFSKDILHHAANQLGEVYDDRWGGFGSAPKFPPSNAVRFLFRDYSNTGNKRSLEMATFTLDMMHRGGMYDHLGGGFHRYSVDNEWLVPHFEKMLYDNAQLAVVYIEAFQATGLQRYAGIAREIFGYVMAVMTDSSGYFYSSEDADSQGKEGIFYLWKRNELDEILSKKDAEIVSRRYNVKTLGNFASHESYHEGLNILHIRKDTAASAEESGMTGEQLERILSGIKKKLRDARDKRVKPGLDDKAVTAWNALMISAFSRGFQVLEDKDYLDAAEKAATFLKERMRTADGRLLRTYRAGRSKFDAYLEDYAYTVRAFVDLYEAGFDERWLFAAEELADEMIAQFWDERTASLFNTGQNHQNLIVRIKSTNDSAIPSPVGVAIDSFLRLAKLLDKKEYSLLAQRILKANLSQMKKAPQAHLSLLMNLNSLIQSSKEIAVVGQKDAKDTKLLLRAIHKGFLPNRVIALLEHTTPKAGKLAEKIPLLAGRELIGGKATAYVCENFACRLPATSPEELTTQLFPK